MTKVIIRKQGDGIFAIFPNVEEDGGTLCYSHSEGFYTSDYDLAMKNSHAVKGEEVNNLLNILKYDKGYKDIQIVKRKPILAPITVYYIEADIFKLFVVEKGVLKKVGEGLADKVENVLIDKEYQKRKITYKRID